MKELFNYHWYTHQLYLQWSFAVFAHLPATHLSFINPSYFWCVSRLQTSILFTSTHFSVTLLIFVQYLFTGFFSDIIYIKWTVWISSVPFNKFWQMHVLLYTKSQLSYRTLPSTPESSLMILPNQSHSTPLEKNHCSDLFMTIIFHDFFCSRISFKWNIA